MALRVFPGLERLNRPAYALRLKGITDMTERRALIKSWVAKANADLKKKKSLGRVDMGSDIQFLDPPRIRTGSVGLDVVTGGGLPRGGCVQFWGEFSSGKTTAAIHCGQAVQNQGGAILWAAAEPFSKDWARQNGLMVPYNEEELEGLREVDPEYAEQVEEEQDDWPEFVVQQHAYGDGLLELLYEGVRSNLFMLAILDSAAAIKRFSDIEEKSVEDQKYGGEASMYDMFAGKMYSAFNTRYDPDTMQPTSGESWVPNQTCMLVINQARAKIGGYNPTGQPQYKPKGGHALEHLWLWSGQFKKGPQLVDKDNKRATPYGQIMRVKCDKSKICPPFRKAEWTYYFDSHGDHGPGEIDTGAELVMWGEYFDILEKRGSYYYFEGELVGNSNAKAAAALTEDTDMADKIYEAVIAAARRT